MLLPGQKPPADVSNSAVLSTTSSVSGLGKSTSDLVGGETSASTIIGHTSGLAGMPQDIQKRTLSTGETIGIAVGVVCATIATIALTWYGH